MLQLELERVVRKRVGPLRHYLILSNSLDGIDIDLLSDGLSALADGIRRCRARITRAYESGSAEYGEHILEQELPVVEALLGCAFVLCQVYITQVVASVGTLRRHVSKLNPTMKLTTTTEKKRSIIKHGGTTVGSSNVAQVELINGLANYFKHRDEWTGDWANLKKDHEKETVRVISACGLTRGSSGNLRTGAEALGNADYVNMQAFTKILTDWRARLFDDYEAELRLKKLV